MKSKRIRKNNEDIAHLDAATQEIILRLNSSDKKLKVAAFCLIVVLLATGVIGVLYQNHYALQNKNHIDCIIKDLATPQPAGTAHKYIDYQTSLTSNCKIKFN